jgi:predicted transcriptional regulator
VSPPQTIAEQLRARREALGLSQRAVATLTGLQQAQLSKIERGTIDPRLSTMTEIARALDLEPVLVPRQTLAAVELVLGIQPNSSGPAYGLDDDA